MKSNGPEGQPANEPGGDDESPTGLRITDGIADALLSGGPINDETAMLIAREITPGSGPIQQFALTGELGRHLLVELAAAFSVHRDFDQTRGWIVALAHYCCYREDAGPITGWPRHDPSRLKEDH